jgi:hypothetical protein
VRITGAQVAKEIRETLKRNYSSIAFSVRYNCPSVSVRWTDGPTQDEVRTFVYRFEGEEFSQESDCYIRKGSFEWRGQMVTSDVHFINLDRDYTKASKDAAAAEVQAWYQLPGVYNDGADASLESASRQRCYQSFYYLLMDRLSYTSF